MGYRAVLDKLKTKRDQRGYAKKTSGVEKQGDFSDCVLTIQQGRRYAEVVKYTLSELQAAVRKRRRMWGL